MIIAQDNGNGLVGGMRGRTGRKTYLQPAQEDEEQPPQPEPLLVSVVAAPAPDLPMPKRDMSFSVFFEPHFSHKTSGLDPKTSFSKSALQVLQ
jgi:hypothetical protein